MAITREFIHEEWDASGEMGLKPSWFDGANPTDGRGVAHDVMEHFKSDPGCLEGECMALGSFLLLRLNNGFGSSTASSITPMGSDVRGLLYDIVENGYDVPKLVKTRPLEEHFEAVVQRAFAEGYAHVEDAIASLHEDVRDAYRQRLLDAREPMLSWVRTGFRRAQRRYRGCDLYSVGVFLFDKVEKMVNSLLRSELLWSGARIRVSVDPRRLRTWASVYENETGRWLDHELFC